eukprot:CAMPEP_0175947834 /NCGR_PEP_ID=MMETSP0108-20121206/28114_1 /TAXON_ID=195067 ORGANISM="Goniomonas pacifica, Strain CCMP1869" /NCGR_SAMPLE_ID=MMETSP0108 /ASSEMBLY_ACC=CAM_ASM_000204 /LENGTH=156 /DNA_ID=CAMNT_0017273525 /DNA_START=18 /DNA_END=488 /DNA_ORIENTATION=-
MAAGTEGYSCRCGACKLEVTGDPMFACFCHCSLCALNHAAPVVPIAGFPFANIKLEGDVTKFASTEGAERCSCKSCGQPMCNLFPAKGFGGTFLTNYRKDQFKGGLPAKFQPQIHICYENRLFDWHDDLPKFRAMPPQFGGPDEMCNPDGSIIAKA